MYPLDDEAGSLPVNRPAPLWSFDYIGSSGLNTFDSDRQIEMRDEAVGNTTALIGDTNRLLTLTLAALLNSQPDFQVVRTFADVTPALDAVEMVEPNVVLLGTDLVLKDPIRCEQLFRGEQVRSRLIVLSSNEDESSLEASIRAGAVGHLHGGLPPDDIVASVRRVQGGEVLFAPELLVGLLRRPSRTSEVSDAPLSAMPGPRELEVLQALARGLSTQEIADSLQITTYTVRSHVRNVTAKLKVRTKLEAVMIALREGLIRL